MANNIYQACLKAYTRMLWKPFFPYKTGQLRGSTSLKRMPISDHAIYRIRFDGSLAPYVEYLEEGTKPHDIPFAFVGRGNWVWWYPYKNGVPFLMGMGGRFNGKFHPGSFKHYGFIKDKCVIYVAQELAKELGGVIK